VNILKLKENKVETPMLDKILAVKEDSRKIGEFLEWLNSKEIVLAKEATENDIYFGEPIVDDVYPLYQIEDSAEKLLAKYFSIDLEAAEKERQGLLAEINTSK
jgi:hypothetical protein